MPLLPEKPIPFLPEGHLWLEAHGQSKYGGTLEAHKTGQVGPHVPLPRVMFVELRFAPRLEIQDGHPDLERRHLVWTHSANPITILGAPIWMILHNSEIGTRDVSAFLFQLL